LANERQVRDSHLHSQSGETNVRQIILKLYHLFLYLSCSTYTGAIHLFRKLQVLNVCDRPFGDFICRRLDLNVHNAVDLVCFFLLLLSPSILPLGPEIARPQLVASTAIRLMLLLEVANYGAESAVMHKKEHVDIPLRRCCRRRRRSTSFGGGGGGGQKGQVDILTSPCACGTPGSFRKFLCTQ
jgi:hypothetical protein